ncbi:hypothetical protein EJB05_08389, partial [Eragrostis curvula]
FLQAHIDKETAQREYAQIFFKKIFDLDEPLLAPWCSTLSGKHCEDAAWGRIIKSRADVGHRHG